MIVIQRHGLWDTTKKLHQYTEKSVVKFVCIGILLGGLIASLDINSKKDLQRISEWRLAEGANHEKKINWEFTRGEVDGNCTSIVFLN